MEEEEMVRKAIYNYIVTSFRQDVINMDARIGIGVFDITYLDTDVYSAAIIIKRDSDGGYGHSTRSFLYVFKLDDGKVVGSVDTLPEIQLYDCKEKFDKVIVKCANPFDNKDWKHRLFWVLDDEDD